MLKGILWDNDGVLVDTERIFYEVNRDCLKPFDIHLTEEDFFEHYLCNNRGAWHLLAEKSVDSESILKLRQARNAVYQKRLLEASNLLMPGIEPVLAWVHKQVKMGVVTSAIHDVFYTIHSKFNLLRYFEFVLTNETYDHSKPSPEPYLLGLRRLNLRPEECLVIEDSPRGLESAAAAGMRCIILKNSLMRDYPFEGAYKLVESAGELLHEMKRLL